MKKFLPQRRTYILWPFIVFNTQIYRAVSMNILGQTNGAYTYINVLSERFDRFFRTIRTLRFGNCTEIRNPVRTVSVRFVWSVTKRVSWSDYPEIYKKNFNPTFVTRSADRVYGLSLDWWMWWNGGRRRGRLWKIGKAIKTDILSGRFKRFRAVFARRTVAERTFIF